MKFKKNSQNKQTKKSAKKEETVLVKSPFFSLGFIPGRFYLALLAVVFIFAFSTIALLFTPSFVSAIDTKFSLDNSPIFVKFPVVDSSSSANLKPLPTTVIIDNHTLPPQFTAAAALAQDIETGKILYEKNINQRLAPASTTKIMTALVAVDHYKPNDVLTVTNNAMVAGSTMNLVVGEEMTFRSMLYGMLLNSGNDAAFAIADNFPGGVSAFVNQMNLKATELGLENTHFQNPAGFDNDDHYSSALDLAKISRVAAANEQIAKVVSTKETEVESYNLLEASGSAKRIHHLTNVNKLVGEDGIIGIKTGYTELAGENLVGLIEKNNQKVLTVILKSNDRFLETKSLMNWVFLNYIWQKG